MKKMLLTLTGGALILGSATGITATNINSQQSPDLQAKNENDIKSGTLFSDAFVGVDTDNRFFNFGFKSLISTQEEQAHIQLLFLTPSKSEEGIFINAKLKTNYSYQLFTYYDRAPELSEDGTYTNVLLQVEFDGVYDFSYLPNFSIVH